MRSRGGIDSDDVIEVADPYRTKRSRDSLSAGHRETSDGAVGSGVDLDYARLRQDPDRSNARST